MLGDEIQKKTTSEAIAEYSGRIRKMAVERINMKFAMDLRFELDPSIEASFKLGEIFKKIHEGQKAEEEPKE